MSKRMFLFDVALLLVSLSGINNLQNYYVPWEATPTGNLATLVRLGPSTNYDALARIEVGDTVTIVGQFGDWYLPSEINEPPKMVRRDTMKAAREGLHRPLETVSKLLQNFPTLEILAIVLLWYWPRVRSCISPNSFEGICCRIRQFVCMSVTDEADTESHSMETKA